jgi:hypothetical protein
VRTFFGNPGGRIAADGSFSIDDLQVYRGGKLNVNRLSFIEGQLNLHPLLQVERILAQNFGADGWLFKGFVIHEVVKFAIRV